MGTRRQRAEGSTRSRGASNVVVTAKNSSFFESEPAAPDTPVNDASIPPAASADTPPVAATAPARRRASRRRASRRYADRRAAGETA